MNELGGGDERPSTDKVQPESNAVVSGCVVLLCLTIIAALITLLIRNEDMPGKLRRQEKVRPCHTPSCYQMTQELRFSATLDVDPCVDFFSYVCTNWVRASSRDLTIASAVGNGFVEELEKQLAGYVPSRKEQGVVDMTAILYHSCVKVGNARPTRVLAKFHLQRWPDFAFTDSLHFDVFSEIMNADLNWNMKLAFKVERVYRPDVARTRIVIRPTPLACPYKGGNSTLERSYGMYVREILQIYGSQDVIAASEVAKVHSQLCNFTMIPGDKYDYYYLGSLINATSDAGIDERQWVRHLKPLGRLKPTSVVYTKLEYVESALRLLVKDTARQRVMQYLGFMIVTQFCATHPRVRAAQDRRPFLILPSYHFRQFDTEPCTKEVMVNFLKGWNVFTLQAANQYRTTTIDVVKMLQSVVVATQKRIRLSAWMDDLSKARTLQKLKKAVIVGPVIPMYVARFNLPDRFARLEAFSDDYYDNLLKIKRSEASFQLSGKKRYSAERNFAAADAEADLKSNAFYVYAGLLRTPYYAESLPLAVKYGGIGTWIARTLAKSLTNEGARTNAAGTARDWWPGSTYKEYLSRATCFAKQANPGSTSASDVDYIDDYLGVRIAYDAMNLALAERKRKWELPNSYFTESQMFFLTYCLGICAGTLRDGKTVLLESAARMCNGALRNMPEFTHAWRCKRNVTRGPGESSEGYCSLY